MSVNNKDILQVWWSLTGFYPSAFDLSCFLSKQCVGMRVSMF